MGPLNAVAQSPKLMNFLISFDEFLGSSRAF